ncbi:trigger factor [Fluviibacter phosphoraccumulans]|uniref:Trigger factor n=1 Tax=Fluviibacter phosphoraccumulans TaxID=1751046 RepID=A0A679I439_9RHOO|nr:trigger factor [Fluviibacter phosphoraccumulans]BBU69265.1 trigger factor [Fluviibacter phosphoraccumulans]BBU71578.1 trigger factor [Fluviibacter phosphoraccumulans]BCA65200.1 trigger factor [Fluviibacter phosphoraccumulans]
MSTPETVQEAPAASVETSPLARTIELTVAAKEVEAATDARLARMGKTLKIAGFRPGKVPAKVVKQHHGMQAHEEALNEIVGRAFGEAITQQNLKVAGYPRIEPKGDLLGETLTFTATFELYPEFTLADVASAEIERPVHEVTAADVDKTLEILRKQRVGYENVDRAAQKEDRVVIDFLGKKDGVAFAGGEAKDYPMVLGKGTLLPEFEAAIEGCTAGTAKTFDLTFPAEYGNTDLAGQTVQFDLNVKQVQGPVIPELDEAFVKAMGVESGKADDLHAEVEKNLKGEVKKRIHQRVREAVMEKLDTLNPIAVPKAMVEQETYRLMQNTREEMKQRGMKGDIPMQPEWFTDRALPRVRMGLILAQLVETENLVATQEQIDARIAEMAETYQHPAEVVQWYKQDRQRLAGIESEVLEENVVAWVLARAKVTEKAIDFDEIMGQQGL